MSTYNILRVVALTVCGVLSARADSAPPHNYNCLQRIEQWQPVNGKVSVQNGSRWLIENGVLRAERPESDSRILFVDPKVNPKWYSLRLTVTGLARVKKAAVGIILGYSDEKNYYVCTFSQTDDQRAMTSLARIRDGREESITSFPFEQRAEDTAEISVEVYAQGSFRLRARVGSRECLNYKENHNAQPSKFGIILSSDTLSITSCTIHGIAKK